MALRHYAYSFDVDTFVASTSALVKSLDDGDIRPLYETTVQTIRNGFQGTWLLDEAGSRLPGVDELARFDLVGLPRSRPVEDYLSGLVPLPPDEVGHWFLIILARYLKRSRGIGADYSVLDAALRNVGWSETDREYLIAGLPCCLLIKSDCTRQSQRIESDPYWYWIVPSHAQSSGWLPYHEVTRLMDLLGQTQPKIRNYDVRQFPNPWGLVGKALADSQTDWNNRLQVAYDRAAMMLETALHTKDGVFMVNAY